MVRKYHANIPVICTRYRPHQGGIRGSVSGNVYHWKKQGHGIALALVSEWDIPDIIKNDNYKVASIAEHRMWRS